MGTKLRHAWEVVFQWLEHPASGCPGWLQILTAGPQTAVHVHEGGGDSMGGAWE